MKRYICNRISISTSKGRPAAYYYIQCFILKCHGGLLLTKSIIQCHLQDFGKKRKADSIILNPGFHPDLGGFLLTESTIQWHLQDLEKIRKAKSIILNPVFHLAEVSTISMKEITIQVNLDWCLRMLYIQQSFKTWKYLQKRRCIIFVRFFVEIYLNLKHFKSIKIHEYLFK